MLNVYVQYRVGTIQAWRTDGMINGFKSDSAAVVIRCCQLTKNIFDQNVTRVENVFHMQSLRLFIPLEVMFMYDGYVFTVANAISVTHCVLARLRY